MSDRSWRFYRPRALSRPAREFDTLEGPAREAEEFLAQLDDLRRRDEGLPPADRGPLTRRPGPTAPGGPMHGPSPDDPEPMPGFPQVGFLKPIVRSPNIIVGDYTYYDDPEGPELFEARNVLYHFLFVGDKLVIGRYCALGRGCRFIMNGANHPMGGFSTYPFFIFGNGWDASAPSAGELPHKGDTVLGNDVWVGHDATVMPGVTVGDGAILAAKSVVTAPVAPYTIVGGNPARLIRQRFPEGVVAELLAMRWWDWPAERVTRNLRAITGADLAALRNAT